MGKVDTKGIWTRISVDPSEFHGLGEAGAKSSSGIKSSIRWGQDEEKSSYDFTGLTDVEARLDGQNFRLGIFTHYNRRIHLTHRQTTQARSTRRCACAPTRAAAPEHCLPRATRPT
ncbi:choice-of-anchor K domain-containing protein [Nocardia aurea]|uniref:choice-of-anchor K domain-containing protein n=1 Tax=Nocardia aurea TaxID=2144174 RepID=UPI000D68E797|nr:choice-of-anchor K domain-containing protein [Nocardia aurea]